MDDGYGYGDTLCEYCQVRAVDLESGYRVTGYLGKGKLLLCGQCTVESLVWANHMRRDVNYEGETREIRISRTPVTKIYIDFDNNEVIAKIEEDNE